LQDLRASELKKPCEHCGVLFGNPRKESRRKFAARRFCGLSCAGSATCAAKTTTHGYARVGKKMPEYEVWSAMRGRCMRKSHKEYAYYGGRGIGVDPRWDDFPTFLEDMGPRPDGHSLDRIDNDKGYGPDNCRWATRAEQNQNTRATRLTPVSVMCMRVLRARGADVSVLASAFGVTKAAAYDAIRRRTWKNVP
jgi:hypothetical protein